MSDEHGPADGIPALPASEDEASSTLLHAADDESSDDEEGPPRLYCDSDSESDDEVLHQHGAIYDSILDEGEGEAAMEISEEDEPRGHIRHAHSGFPFTSTQPSSTPERPLRGTPKHPPGPH